MYVHPVPLIENTPPCTTATGSTATVAIGQIVAMKVVTSMSRRKYLVGASRSATRRPVLHRTTFHARLIVARRQNATNTPAVSARLTNVELRENATTSPSTATTPSVFALRPRIHAGARAAHGRPSSARRRSTSNAMNVLLIDTD